MKITVELKDTNTPKDENKNNPNPGGVDRAVEKLKEAMRDFHYDSEQAVKNHLAAMRSLHSTPDFSGAITLENIVAALRSLNSTNSPQQEAGDAMMPLNLNEITPKIKGKTMIDEYKYTIVISDNMTIDELKQAARESQSAIYKRINDLRKKQMPEYKEGDWVVLYDGKVGKISKIDGCIYYLENIGAYGARPIRHATPEEIKKATKKPPFPVKKGDFAAFADIEKWYLYQFSGVHSPADTYPSKYIFASTSSPFMKIKPVLNTNNSLNPDDWTYGDVITKDDLDKYDLTDVLI